MKHTKISEVIEGSIAEEVGIEAGDCLLKINGQFIQDVFDYRFLSAEEKVLIEILKTDGNTIEVDIEKDQWEDIGVCFEKPLLDGERSCRNKCIFCFIDQLPHGMRESLYYKDDDIRLSFLFGNYITMTNMNPKELKRIVRYRMSPVNISVHTTNPELRIFMLGNRFARNIIKDMKFLKDSGIIINTQIVLCKGVNDGTELDRTLEDLTELIPGLNSISVVPVGLTRFREELPYLEAFDKTSALSVIHQVEEWQRLFVNKTGSRRVYLSDEWYLMSDIKLPGYEQYEDFPQIENGVGMAAAFTREFQDALLSEEKREVQRTVSIATGTLAYSIILKLAKQAENHFKGLNILVYPIENCFFGNTVTVTGLITGGDLKTQLLGKPLGNKLLLSASMFKSGTELFLDDMKVSDLERCFKTRIQKVENEGAKFCGALIT